MAQTKRAWKHQEFVAHGSNVNCLAIGHKSGRVLVTGGEDRKVNLWAVGKPNCVMSLTGHTMPVEAVRFGHEEEMVVAGSISGALKVWDLEQAKIMRTLTGHKSSIRSLDFHPYGDYTASGSLDANVKLWDIRRKGCIFTYKGHTNCVNCVRFSPDGKWIASAGEDGLVKIWDLTAGKLMTDLNGHTGPVNIVEFHPNELLLASGSSDRTVKFWDLENFGMVSSTDGDSTPVRTIFYHPEGSCLFSGCKDLLKSYSWEPSQCHDTVPIAWGEVADMAMTQNQLIGASFSQTNVSLYVVDLQRVQPFGGSPADHGNSSLSSSHRKSFITERPPTQSTRQASVPKEDEHEPTNDKEDVADDKESSFDIKDPDDYREIFQPKSRLSHSPSRKVEPFQPPPEDVDNEPVRQPAPATQRNKTTSKPVSKPPVTKTNSNKQPSKPSQPEKKISPRQPPVQAPAKEKEPPGIAAEDFLPKGIGEYGDFSKKEASEEEVLGTIGKGHNAMSTVMSNRSKNLQIVRAMWTSGSTKAAVDSAISMKDPSVIVDLLNVLNLKSGLWNLDLCNSLLPHFEDLMNSKYESYVTTVCSSLKVVLKNFGPVIKANLTAPPSVGVDITREERYRKCNACYAQIMKLRSIIEKRSHAAGNVGSVFREIQILMSNID